MAELMGVAFTLRQMSQQASFRLLTAYTASVAITALAAVGVARSMASPLLSMLARPSELFSTLADVVVAVSAVGGAILAHSPVPATTKPLLNLLSQRLTGTSRYSENINPLHGALLLGALSTLVPAGVCVGFLVSPMRPQGATPWLAASASFAVIASLIGAASGAAALALYRMRGRSSLLPWLVLWTAPELLRQILAGVPTCRTLVSGVLSGVAILWGIH